MKKKMSKVIAKVISTVLAVTLVIGLSPAILAETAYHTETPATGSQTDNESSETATPEEDTTNEESTTQGIVPFTDAGPLIRNNTSAKGRSAKILAQEEEEGLILDKTAKVVEGEDDRYSINMEAFVTGKVTSEPVPADIVLVLDQSSSMWENMTGTKEFQKIYEDQLDKNKAYYVADANGSKTILVVYKGKKWIDIYGKDQKEYKPKTSNSDRYNKQFYKPTTNSKLELLKSSVTSFVNAVEDDAIKNNVDYRIAIVGFASAEGSPQDMYANTELFIGSNQYNVNDTTKIDEQYKKAFQDVRTSKDKLLSSINALDANGATQIDYGIEIANNVFMNNPTPKDQKRNKIMIVFTDGWPTKLSTYDSDVANAAIKQAELAKANTDTTVYTIGVIDGVNPNADIVKNPTSYKDVANKLLHYISTNFDKEDKALEMNNNTRLIPDKSGYYLSASNASELEEIFKKLSQNLDPSLELDESTVLNDVITKYFKMVGEAEVNVYTADYNGRNLDGSRKWKDKKKITTIDIDKDSKPNTITVSGFDYTSNAVYDKVDATTENKGKKLIVEVSNLTRADGFIGGNHVPTNTSDSGVSNEEVKVDKKFPEPDVDVYLKYAFTTKPQSIYIGNQWNELQKFFLNEDNIPVYSTSVGGKEFLMSGINNKFVTIEYDVKDSKQNSVGKYVVKAGETQGSWIKKPNYNTVNLTGTETFTVEATITPIESGTINEINPETKEDLKQDANLYIFKPDIMASDDYVFLGDTTNLLERISDGIEWFCKDQKDPKDEKIPNPDETTKPELKFEFENISGTPIGTDPAKYEPKVDSDFKVKVVNGTTDTDITRSTTITNEDGKNDKHDFTIHVVKGQLEITKSINQQYTTAKAKNANQTFLFKVERRLEKDGVVVETFYQTLDFSANEENTIKSVNIKGLQKGYYTVSEVNDWSWKYNEIAGRRKDNYKGNGIAYGVSENSMIFIGDKDKNNTTGFTFYGTEVGTVINGKNEALPAQTAFVNELSDKKILSDTASAVNTFQSFDKMISGLNKFKKYR